MIDSGPLAFWTGVIVFLALLGIRAYARFARWRASPRPVGFIEKVEPPSSQGAPRNDATTDTSSMGEFMEALTAGVMVGALIQLLFLFMRHNGFDVFVKEPWYGDPWALLLMGGVLGRQVYIYVHYAILSATSSSKNPSH